MPENLREAAEQAFCDPTVDHIAIIVRDAAEAAATFCDRFGMTIASDERIPGVNARLLSLTTSSVDIQLVEPTAPGQLEDYLQKNGEGLHHLCLRVEQMESAVLQLREDPSAIFTGGWGRRTFFLAERVHGVLLELAEGAPPQSILIR